MSINTSVMFVFCLSFISLFVLRKFAKRIGLVDKPNGRKMHVGQVPLVGGVAIFLTLALALILLPPLLDKPILYFSCASILVLIGVIDDRYDISFKLRLVVQATISLAMIIIGDRSLHNFGYLMGSEILNLPELISYIVTIFAVVGAINAFNMVDGIDGLLGGLASVTFGALGILFYQNTMFNFATFCALLVTAMLPYILLNLGIPFGRRFKVFMGDAGSIFIGFTVIWLLIVASQGERAHAIRPVTALWLIALPLMDMVCIMIRRIRKGQSPFQPDREHLHHICQRLGMSSAVSLLFICSMAAIMAAVGIWSELNAINESIMFVTFLAVFIIYFQIINNIWRLTSFLHKHFRFTLPSHD
jgi:UDP-GlcNAc:undecaprenyl-phosphate/decaprenyl-phosphate GlcNAc-1-phosphate transferase